MEMRSQRLITAAGIVRLRPLQRADLAEWRAARLGDEEILRTVEPTGEPDSKMSDMDEVNSGPKPPGRAPAPFSKAAWPKRS